MHFQDILCAAALAVVATALPQSPPNVLSTVYKPPVVDGANPFVGLSTESLDVSTLIDKAEGSVVKRFVTLTVDVWLDVDRGSRHEGLISQTQSCYNLQNGWNDQISSLSVPSGFGCMFFADFDCSSAARNLTVPHGSGNYMASLLDVGFNDLASSYLCYDLA